MDRNRYNLNCLHLTSVSDFAGARVMRGTRILIYILFLAFVASVALSTAAVAGVRDRKQKDPSKYDPIFDRAENIAYLAKDALIDEDYHEVGKLMNENHKLLQQIEVSSKELDFLVKLAREHGAYGAKLTGGGLGGNMIALTPGRDLQDDVANAIEKEGFQTVKTVIGATRKGE